MISLVIILALVTVPLVLIARLSFTVLARLLGVVSQSEVATRAEFARIREQLLATAGDCEQVSRGARGVPDAAVLGIGREATERPHGRAIQKSPEPAMGQEPADLVASSATAPAEAQWRRCPKCATNVPSTASMCLQCGAGLAAPS